MESHSPGGKFPLDISEAYKRGRWLRSSGIDPTTPGRDPPLVHRALGEQIVLEHVLGMTVYSNSALTSDACSGLVAYPAGCVLVLLDTVKNKQLGTLHAPRKSITAVSFSPDGRYVLTGESGLQPAVRVWDITLMTEVAMLRGHSFGIRTVVFSPRMREIIVLGDAQDMMISVWSWPGQVMGSLNKFSDEIYAMDVSSSNLYFVTVGNKHVKFYYLETKRSPGSLERATCPIPLTCRYGMLDNLKENCFCDVACGRAGNAYVFVVTTSGILCQINSNRFLERWVNVNMGRSFCLTTDGSHVFVGGCQGIIRMFDAHNLKIVLTLPRPHCLGLDIAQMTPTKTATPMGSEGEQDNEEDKAVATSLSKANPPRTPAAAIEQHNYQQQQQQNGPQKYRQLSFSARRTSKDGVSKNDHDDEDNQICDDDGRAEVGRSGVKVKRVKGRQHPGAKALTFDPIHQNLTVVYEDNSIYIWGRRESRQGEGSCYFQKRYSSMYHRGSVWDLTTYPLAPLAQQSTPTDDRGDGEVGGALPPGTLLSVSADGTLRAWDVSADICQESVLKRNSVSPQCLKIVYAERPDTTTGPKKPAHIEASVKRRTSSQERLPGASALKHRKQGFTVVSVCPDGVDIAAGNRHGRVSIYDTNTMVVTATMHAHEAEVTALSYSITENYKVLASGSRDRMIHLMDAARSYQLLTTLDDHSSTITAINFTYISHYLIMATSSLDMSVLVRVYLGSEAFILNPVRAIVEKKSIMDFAIHPWSGCMAFACQDRYLRVYSIMTSSDHHSFRGCPSYGGQLVKVQFDPSGQYLLTACSLKTINLLQYATGTLLSTFNGHAESITSIRFSHNVKHVISAAVDGCIFLWRLPESITYAVKRDMAEMGRLTRGMVFKRSWRKSSMEPKRVASEANASIDVCDNTLDASIRSCVAHTEPINTDKHELGEATQGPCPQRLQNQDLQAYTQGKQPSDLRERCLRAQQGSQCTEEPIERSSQPVENAADQRAITHRESLQELQSHKKDLMGNTTADASGNIVLPAYSMSDKSHVPPLNVSGHVAGCLSNCCQSDVAEKESKAKVLDTHKDPLDLTPARNDRATPVKSDAWLSACCERRRIFKLEARSIKKILGMMRLVTDAMEKDLANADLFLCPSLTSFVVGDKTKHITDLDPGSGCSVIELRSDPGSGSHNQNNLRLREDALIEEQEAGSICYTLEKRSGTIAHSLAEEGKHDLENPSVCDSIPAQEEIKCDADMAEEESDVLLNAHCESRSQSLKELLRDACSRGSPGRHTVSEGGRVSDGKKIVLHEDIFGGNSLQKQPVRTGRVGCGGSRAHSKDVLGRTKQRKQQFGVNITSSNGCCNWGEELFEPINLQLSLGTKSSNIRIVGFRDGTTRHDNLVMSEQPNMSASARVREKNRSAQPNAWVDCSLVKAYEVGEETLVASANVPPSQAPGSISEDEISVALPSMNRRCIRITGREPCTSALQRSEAAEVVKSEEPGNASQCSVTCSEKSMALATSSEETLLSLRDSCRSKRVQSKQRSYDRQVLHRGACIERDDIVACVSSSHAQSKLVKSTSDTIKVDRGKPCYTIDTNNDNNRTETSIHRLEDKIDLEQLKTSKSVDSYQIEAFLEGHDMLAGRTENDSSSITLRHSKLKRTKIKKIKKCDKKEKSDREMISVGDESISESLDGILDQSLDGLALDYSLTAMAENLSDMTVSDVTIKESLSRQKKYCVGDNNIDHKNRDTRSGEERHTSDVSYNNLVEMDYRNDFVNLPQKIENVDSNSEHTLHADKTSVSTQRYKKKRRKSALKRTGNQAKKSTDETSTCQCAKSKREQPPTPFHIQTENSSNVCRHNQGDRNNMAQDSTATAHTWGEGQVDDCIRQSVKLYTIGSEATDYDEEMDNEVNKDRANVDVREDVVNHTNCCLVQIQRNGQRPLSRGLQDPKSNDVNGNVVDHDINVNGSSKCECNSEQIGSGHFQCESYTGRSGKSKDYHIDDENSKCGSSGGAAGDDDNDTVLKNCREDRCSNHANLKPELYSARDCGGCENDGEDKKPGTCDSNTKCKNVSISHEGIQMYVNNIGGSASETTEIAVS